MAIDLSQIQPLPECPFGEGCTRKNPLHFTTESHPCSFGNSCYRSNPDHFREKTHPPEMMVRLHNEYIRRITSGSSSSSTSVDARPGSTSVVRNTTISSSLSSRNMSAPPSPATSVSSAASSITKHSSILIVSDDDEEEVVAVKKAKIGGSNADSSSKSSSLTISASSSSEISKKRTLPSSLLPSGGSSSSSSIFQHVPAPPKPTSKIATFSSLPSASSSSAAAAAKPSSSSLSSFSSSLSSSFGCSHNDSCVCSSCVSNPSLPCADCVVVFTGALSILRRDAEAMVHDLGGVVADQVSSRVTHLVTSANAAAATNPSAKLASARKKGIHVVGEDWLLARHAMRNQKSKHVSTSSTSALNKSAAVSLSSAGFGSIPPSPALSYVPSSQPASSKPSSVHSSPASLSSFAPKAGGVISMEDFLPDGDLIDFSRFVDDDLESKQAWEDEIPDFASASSSSSSPAAASSAFVVDNHPDEHDGGSDAPKPLHVMNEGDTFKVKGNSGEYEIRLRGGVHYCTCMGWKMSPGGVDQKTCKHLKEHLGDKFDNWRRGVDPDDHDVPTASRGGRASSSSSSSKAAGKQAAPKLLLAHKLEDTDVSNWWISEKLDGVRAYWNGTVFLSRNGNEFIAPSWFTAGLPTTETLDGELFMGREKFQQTVGIVKSLNGGDRWKTLTYQVFDAPSKGNLPFEQRVQYLATLNGCCPYLRVVKQTRCESRAQLEKYVDDVVAHGGEGAMVRQPGSIYVGSRSTTLFKVKRFLDDEVKVIGYEPGKGKYKGMTGSLQCRLRNGLTVNVGSGMSDAERRNPPPVGSIITIKFQELTDGNIPRFPTFIGVRIDANWP